jgi:hypothetical protein
MTQHIHFWWISFVLEGVLRILCFPNTDIMSIHFTVDVKSRLVTKSKP